MTRLRWTLDGITHTLAGASTTIQFLLTTAAADYGLLQNYRLYMDTTPAATSLWINLIGADYSVVRNNIIMVTLKNEAASMTLTVGTTKALGLVVDGNIIYQDGGTTQDDVVVMYSGTTGIYSNNRTFGNVGTLAASIDLASMAASESYQATSVNKSGILDPVVA